MAETFNENKQENNDLQNAEQKTLSISGLYQNWFLDYASYVILERAVPHIKDGLKPVQRRILHAMKELDDGRYNKVANIIGHTMKYHPHGDASIGEALVQLGQKDLLIDMQGNWGNIYTGDSAAAPRYIEARLSKFALEVLFNPKTTIWKKSYDGRNNEPVHLPVKFPLLLALGVEGIAVGLASKILPHNFIELLDASIAYLKKEEFTLYPDFPTGGYIDITKYNDGLRGGKIKIRAKIEKTSSKILTITELPFGKTTSSLIDSIISANDKGKIKIKKIEDKTSDKVNIIIHLGSDLTPDQAIDALYAFTDCEISISPNSTVIDDDKPKFLGVTEILKRSADNTKQLLETELKIEIDELNEKLFFASLEKIFIENRIYLEIEKCTTFEEIIQTIDTALEPFKPKLLREVTRDDIIKLTEIKIKRISKYDSFKADNYIKELEERREKAQYNLDHIVQYTIDYFNHLKEKYGKGRERKTEIRNFDEINAASVAVANKKLYVNFKDGFAGYNLKDGEYFADCSEYDDVIVFQKDGTYFVTRVSEKFFIGTNVIHLDIFRKNDDRTTYNVAYLDGKTGNTYVKRFTVSSIIKDKKYNLTQGHKYSKILYFSANPNGEAEIVVVKHRPKPRLKKLKFDFDFSTIAIRNRSAKGNLLTKHAVHKITIKEKGLSTLGGIKIWYDPKVFKLKNSETEIFVGEFNNDDSIIAVCQRGYFRTTGFELTNHYEPDTIYISKFNPEKVYNAVYFNAEQGFVYFKRFTFDKTSLPTPFISEAEGSYLIAFEEGEKLLLEITFGGKDKKREPKIIDTAEFISVKSYQARGKRLTTYEIDKLRFIKTQTEQEEPKEQTLFENTDTIDFEVTLPDGKKINLSDNNNE